MKIFREKIDQDKKIYKYYDKPIISDQKKEITDKKIVEYLNTLTIPPAYDDVEIFYEKKPKILFQGKDKEGRLQQIYSSEWRAKADKEKFKALIDFGKKMPMILLDIKKNIQSNKQTKEKLISIMLRIVGLCGFRVGQLKYQKLYGSTGLTTLMKKHVKYNSEKKQVCIDFVGKKGVKNYCCISDPELVQEINKITEHKNEKDFIFVYKDVDNTNKLVSALDINDWLKTYNVNFTSKFFRTFSVNIKLIEILKDIDPNSMNLSQRKKYIVGIIKEISESINNTAAICKKSYLNPDLIKLFLEHPRKYNTDINKNTLSATDNFIKFLENLYS